MAIERMNYFKGEFLEAKDFQCEQKYHLDMRRRHNQYLHTPGVMDGLEVIPGFKKVTIKKGAAIDKNGKEIILEEQKDVAITSAAVIGIKYKEEEDPASDNKDTTFPGKKRIKEIYELTLTLTEDPDAITLAKVTNASTSPVTLDPYFKPTYSGPAVMGDLTVKGSLTVQGETTVVKTERMQGNVELGDQDTDIVTVRGILKTGHSSEKLKVTSPVDITGDITITGKIDGRDVSADGTKLDNHAGITSGNPHGMTHAMLSDKGVKTHAEVDAHIAAKNPHNLTASDINAVTTAHRHNGIDSDKIPAISSTHFVDLSGANLTGINPNSISGVIPESKIDSVVARDEEIKSLLPLVRKKHAFGAQLSTNSTVFTDITDLTLTFTINRAAMFLCIFNASPAGNDTAGTRTYWQMLLDNSPIGYAMKHAAAAWALDSVVIVGVQYAAKGQHTVKIQWKVSSGNGQCPHINSNYGDIGMRGLTVVEFPTVVDLQMFNSLSSAVSAIDWSKFTIKFP